MSDKLLNCPFCGGEAATAIKSVRGIATDNIRFKIYCPICKIERCVDVEFHCGFEEAEKAKQEVIEKWNNRVPDTNVGEIEEQEADNG